MKRKLFFIATIAITLYSCGPHRLQCDPGRRCDVQQKFNPHAPENHHRKANT